MTATGTALTAADPALVRRFAEALERLNPDGGKIGLAVSGGPDSMAMLLLAHAAIPGGFEVATVDHGLRPEAADECALVVAACEARGIPCEVLPVQVGSGNLQAEARRARYAALNTWASSRDLDAIATAHHVDDQAETFLMRLNRGSGLSGLAGVRESHVEDLSGLASFQFIRVLRPLLAMRRDELMHFVEKSGVRYATDPSNADKRFDRVKMRENLRACEWLDPVAVMRSASLLGEAEEFIRYKIMQSCDQRLTNVGNTIEYRRSIDSFENVEVIRELYRQQGKAPSRSDIASMVRQLMEGNNACLNGILVRSKRDNDGKVVWVFSEEPPRRTG